MSDSEQGEPTLSEVTGTFHYQELIESRLGQPISADLTEVETKERAASPGAKLAAARNASGWSVEQVAAQLKMAPRQINALEKDDYAALPDAAIVKGFTRTYAKLLKLDPTPILALLDADMKNKESFSGKATARPENASGNKPGKENKKDSTIFSPGLFIFACIVAALVSAYYYLRH